MHKSNTPGHKGHGLTALTMVITKAAIARMANMVTIMPRSSCRHRRHRRLLLPMARCGHLRLQQPL
jgi:hypothetical protein